MWSEGDHDHHSQPWGLSALRAGQGPSPELRDAIRGRFWLWSFLERPFPHSCYEDSLAWLACSDPEPLTAPQPGQFISVKTGDRKGGLRE